MLIYILIACMILLLFCAWYSMQKDLISPPVMFVSPFVVALICASIYQGEWDLDMYFDTFLVLLCGCTVFVFFCFIIHNTLGKKIRKKASSYRKKNELIFELQKKPIVVKKWKIIAIIMVQFFSIMIVISSMRNVLSQYGVGGSLSLLMYYYREYHMFSDYDVQISGLASNLRLFSIASSYICIYIMCQNYILKKAKPDFLIIVSIILGFANSVILGARGEAIQLILAIIIMFYFLQRKFNNWHPNIKFRQIILVGIILVAIMAGFKASGDLLGRQAVIKYSTNAVDEVAKYLGAEIKNLDIFIRNPVKTDQIIGSQTFGNFLSWIDTKLDLGWDIKQVLPFNKVNGISLGNVYTVFYSYIYDFGYFGIFWTNAIAAILSQIIYEYAVKERKKDVFNLRIILNSYILFLVAFSFFGERFFNNILCIAFIKYIIVWKVIIWFLMKFNIRIIR